MQEQQQRQQQGRQEVSSKEGETPLDCRVVAFRILRRPDRQAVAHIMCAYIPTRTTHTAGWCHALGLLLECAVLIYSQQPTCMPRIQTNASPMHQT